MVRFNLLVLGVVLILLAAGAFAYRHLSVVDASVTEGEAAARAASVRTVLMRGSEISYPIDLEADPRGERRVVRPYISSIEILNLIFNLLNVLVGIMGLWFAGQSLRTPTGPAPG